MITLNLKLQEWINWFVSSKDFYVWQHIDEVIGNTNLERSNWLTLAYNIQHILGAILSRGEYNIYSFIQIPLEDETVEDEKQPHRVLPTTLPNYCVQSWRQTPPLIYMVKKEIKPLEMIHKLGDVFPISYFDENDGFSHFFVEFRDSDEDVYVRSIVLIEGISSPV